MNLTSGPRDVSGLYPTPLRQPLVLLLSGGITIFTVAVPAILDLNDEGPPVAALLAPVNGSGIATGLKVDTGPATSGAAEHTPICAPGENELDAMKRIVISLGGSVLVPSLEENHIREYATILRHLGKEHRIFVVVGGGGEARRYIGVARSLGIDESTADELGILVTRLNATLLAGALRDAAYPKIAESYRDAAGFGESGKIVVMGGVIPGQTTDAVAALLAEKVRADLIINWTSVDGIYSADPKKHPDAVKHSILSPGELQAIIQGDRLEAGSNTVFDTLAAKIIGRSGIPLIVLDGRKPEDPRKAIRGKKGTLVSEKKGWKDIGL